MLLLFKSKTPFRIIQFLLNNTLRTLPHKGMADTNDELHADNSQLLTGQCEGHGGKLGISTELTSSCGLFY